MQALKEVKEQKIPVSTQCELLGISRSKYYYKAKERAESDISNLIYEIWSKYQFYGYRKITVDLHEMGYQINHKKVLRIMRQIGIYALVPGPHTSRKSGENIKTKHPYLLNKIDINKPHKAWQIRLPSGFVYLVALIDVFSRFVTGWQIRNIMDADLCLSALDNALMYYHPEIINTDQGSQFTSELWENSMAKNNITPSMTGKGRCRDNVYIERFWRSIKVEEIYLIPPDNIKDLQKQTKCYIEFHNHERYHQALDYKTPAFIAGIQL